MKLIKGLTYIAIGVMAISAVSCDENDCPAPDKNKYVYDIPQTNLDHDVVTGAYYTNITSSSTWLKSGKKIYTGTPVLGEYLSTNLEALEQQLKWADDAALDFFVFTWDGSANDNTLIANFKATRAKIGAKVKFIINYNTTHLKVTNAAPLQSDANMTKMLGEFTSKLIPEMTGNDYYHLPDGSAPLMVSPVNLSSSAIQSINYATVNPLLRQHLTTAGVNPYLIGEFTNGWTAPVNYEATEIGAFDAVTLKDWKTNVYDRYYAFFSFIDLSWTNWRNTIDKSGTDLVPCIFPSFSDRVNSSSSYYYEFGLNGSTGDYVDFCNVAKRNIGSKSVVLINSWNDYQKGTNLEPTKENEGNFLTVTRAQFKK